MYFTKVKYTNIVHRRYTASAIRGKKQYNHWHKIISSFLALRASFLVDDLYGVRTGHNPYRNI